jgi:hypothetical protein
MRRKPAELEIEFCYQLKFGSAIYTHSQGGPTIFVYILNRQNKELHLVSTGMHVDTVSSHKCVLRNRVTRWTHYSTSCNFKTADFETEKGIANLRLSTIPWPHLNHHHVTLSLCY